MTDLPWWSRTVIMPTTESDRECIVHVQRVLELTPTGEMNSETRQGVISVQTVFGLPVTGAVDFKTAQQIERLRRWESM